MRNKRTDTSAIVEDIVSFMIQDIKDGLLLGAYAHKIDDQYVMFMHAGIGPNFYKYLKLQLKSQFSVENIVKYVNSEVLKGAERCRPYPCGYFNQG
jgi:hypothetical protein